MTQGLGRQIGTGPDSVIAAAIVVLHLSVAGIGKVCGHAPPGGYQALAHSEVMAHRAVEEGWRTVDRLCGPGLRGVVLGFQLAADGYLGNARRADDGTAGRGLGSGEASQKTVPAIKRAVIANIKSNGRYSMRPPPAATPPGKPKNHVCWV